MPKKQNLIGQKFNRLLVINTVPSRNKKTFWKCQCDCGNICEVRADQLKSNNTKSCGCLNTEVRSKLGKSHIKDITNQRFGKLQAIKRLDIRLSKNQGYLWECLCDCGNIIQVSINDLKSGNTTSCGCSKESIGEKNIGILLLTLQIPFETQKTFKDLYNLQKNKQLKYDFYLPNENILIEFDGPQHYKKTNFTSNQTIINDQIKNEWSLKHNIKLYRIPYTEKENILKKKTLEELCKKEYLVNVVNFYNWDIKLNNQE